METFTPVFNTEEEKYIMIAMLVCCLFIGFLSPLIIMIVAKEKLSDLSLQILKAFLNFELFMLILLVVTLIPIIGWILSFILCPVIFVCGILFPVWGLIAAANNQAFKLPVLFKFVS